MLKDITTYVLENDVDKIVLFLPDNEESKVFINKFTNSTNFAIDKVTDIGIVLSLN